MRDNGHHMAGVLCKGSGVDSPSVSFGLSYVAHPPSLLCRCGSRDALPRPVYVLRPGGLLGLALHEFS